MNLTGACGTGQFAPHTGACGAHGVECTNGAPRAIELRALVAARSAGFAPENFSKFSKKNPGKNVQKWPI